MRLLLLLLLLSACTSAEPPAAPLPAPIADGEPLPATFERRPDSHLRERRDRGELPPLPDREALYPTLGPHPSPLDGLLLCAISPSEPLPEGLRLRLVEGGPEAPLQVGAAGIASLPSPPPPLHAALLTSEGDPWDRLVGDPAQGTPLVLTGAKASATCRLLPAEALQPRLLDAGRAADRAISAFERRARVDLRAFDLGMPWTERAAAEAAVDDVAALVGWSAPESRPRVQRLLDAEERAGRAIRQAVALHLAQATPPGRAARRPGDGSLKIVALRCGPSPPGCGLQIDGDSQGLEVVAPDGRTTPLHPSEEHPDLLLGPEPTLRAAVLVRVVEGEGVHFWRAPSARD